MAKGKQEITEIESDNNGDGNVIDNNNYIINSKILKTEASIKEKLQYYNDPINRGKYRKEEYKCFLELGDQYLNSNNFYSYPKAASIYQYCKKFINKYLEKDKAKLEEINKRIESVQNKFLSSLNIKSNITINSITNIADNKNIIENLKEFREEIKAKLLSIEDLGLKQQQGIIKDPIKSDNNNQEINNKEQELDEEGLIERAKKVEEIYEEIRDYLIGSGENGKAKGLFNSLIKETIAELGGVPKVNSKQLSDNNNSSEETKEARTKEQGQKTIEVEYSIFGMGSLSLGTTTPWSDLEFGIIIEEGLPIDDDKRVREYFRQFTALLNIKIIELGETPLRMMGIEELNNFKDIKKENEWFFDELSRSGISFDGPHWHACKSPLGRCKGYKKIITNQSGIKEEKECEPYELIGTISEFMQFQTDQWHKEDPQLVQALRNVILIEVNSGLLTQYKEKLQEPLIKEQIKLQSFEILKQDAKAQDPEEQIFDNNKEGQLVQVKKEIYRFIDRVIVAFSECLEGEGRNSWKKIRYLGEDKQLTIEGAKNLQLALSIAAETRLRTYSKYNSQREEMTTFSGNKFIIEDPSEESIAREVFYLKDLVLLYRYYYISLKVKPIVMSNNSISDLINKCQNNDFIESGFAVKGHIYKRFLQYNHVLSQFKKALDSSLSNEEKVQIENNLLRLYNKLARYSEALLFIKGINEDDHLLEIGITYEGHGNYKEALNYFNRADEKPNSNYFKKSKIYNNIGAVYQAQANYGQALEYFQRGLEVLPESASSLDRANFYNNIGTVYQAKAYYGSAEEYFNKALIIYRKLYIFSLIATAYQNLGVLNKAQDNNEKALEYFNSSLNIKKEIFKDNLNHNQIADTYNNIGLIYDKQKKLLEAKEAYEKVLEIQLIVYKNNPNHHEIARTYNNLALLYTEEDPEKALDFFNKVLNIYKNNHHNNDADYFCNLGHLYLKICEYDNSLKAYKEALTKLEKMYDNNDHPDIAGCCYSIGSIYTLRGETEEARKYFQKALEMNLRVYKDNPNHPELNIIKEQLKNLDVLSRGPESPYMKLKALLDNIYIARMLLSDKSNISLLTDDIRVIYFITQDLPHDLYITLKLVHIVHLAAQDKTNIFDCKKYLQCVKYIFEKALTSETGSKQASLYAEYGMFLLKYHKLEDKNEYSIITGLLQTAIEIGADNSSLNYDKLEAKTTVKPIQELLEKQESVIIKPYILAHYLTVILHHKHNDKQAIEVAIGEFSKAVKSLEGKEEYAVCLYLIADACKEIGYDYQAKIYTEEYNKLSNNKIESKAL